MEQGWESQGSLETILLLHKTLVEWSHLQNVKNMMRAVRALLHITKNKVGVLGGGGGLAMKVEYLQGLQPLMCPSFL